MQERVTVGRVLRVAPFLWVARRSFFACGDAQKRENRCHFLMLLKRRYDNIVRRTLRCRARKNKQKNAVGFGCDNKNLF